MSSNLNLCQFIGRLTDNVSLTYTPSGVACAKLRIAVNNSWKDKNTDEKRDSVQYIPITMWRKLAEIANQYLSKGSQIYVSGEWETSSWEKDGEMKYFTQLVANQLQMLGSRGDSERQNQSSQQSSNGDFTLRPTNEDEPF